MLREAVGVGITLMASKLYGVNATIIIFVFVLYFIVYCFVLYIALCCIVLIV